MKYTVFYPTDIMEIENAYNDNIDVCLTLDSGKTFTLLFITPDNLKSLMKKDKVHHIDPCFKFIVVEKITKEIIENIIESLVSNDEILSYYGL